MDDLIGVFVAVVLVGDVDVGTGLDVAADVDGEVADDMAAPSDHGAVADADHRIGHHLLPGDHSGRQAHIRTHQRILADVHPLLAEDRTRGEREAASPAEGAKPIGQAVARAGGAMADHPVPAGVNGRVEVAVSQPAHVASRGHPGMRREASWHGPAASVDQTIRFRCPVVGVGTRCAHPSTVSDGPGTRRSEPSAVGSMLRCPCLAHVSVRACQRGP